MEENYSDYARHSKRGYGTLSPELEEIAKKIVDSAYTVHVKLGPGLLEKVYEVCFCYELEKRGLSCRRQVILPIHYDDMIFDEGLRLDVFVEEKVICELKAIKELRPIDKAQIISHMKLLDRRLGFLINFNVVRIKDGIHRFINT
jgi:GxxExxY protein